MEYYNVLTHLNVKKNLDKLRYKKEHQIRSMMINPLLVKIITKIL
jgi:hypothetical protein